MHVAWYILWYSLFLSFRDICSDMVESATALQIRSKLRYITCGLGFEEAIDMKWKCSTQENQRATDYHSNAVDFHHGLHPFNIQG